MEKLWTKDDFKCDRHCGECCKSTLVELNPKDIKRIKKLGYAEDKFITSYPSDEKRLFLKKDGKGWCVFLKQDKKGVYSCSIYNDRPEICQKYPFFTGKEKIISCLPQDIYPNVFFIMPRAKPPF